MTISLQEASHLLPFFADTSPFASASRNITTLSNFPIALILEQRYCSQGGVSDVFIDSSNHHTPNDHAEYLKHHEDYTSTAHQSTH